MVHTALYTCNIILLLTGLLIFTKEQGASRFSLALVQTMACLPLLVGEYFFLAADMRADTAQLVLFSEIIFGLIWLSMTMSLHRATTTMASDSRGEQLGEVVIGAVTALSAGYFVSYQPEVFGSQWIVPLYSADYFSAILILLIVLYGAWRLEQFWRSLSGSQRWEYKFLIVGCFLVCGVLAWSSSYRLTYLNMASRHLNLLASLLFLGWIMISYAVVSHGLLNRRIFVSRKIVYTSVVPSLFAAYLFGFGLLALLMRNFGIELEYLSKWLLLVSGLVVIGVFICSEPLRRRIEFYISTHFYINKYEYRDEWLALSEQLQGASTEQEVVTALRKVLENSLYTNKIIIWLGDSENSVAYRTVGFFDTEKTNLVEFPIAPDDHLVHYLKSHNRFTLQGEDTEQSWKQVVKEKKNLFTALGLKLMAPIAINDQLVGIIGLGPEFTGGEYGDDDFDLLTALGSQTASALLTIRMAEQLAHMREQQAWDRLSAFVLHDIKNAATMLGLLRENAPDHIHEAEFQQDMLELVDDALDRMKKVEQRLRSLQDEVSPDWHDLDVGNYLWDVAHLIKKKLPGLEVMIQCPDMLIMKSDGTLLLSILENLLLNSYESGGEDTAVEIRVRLNEDSLVEIQLTDNGPGIAKELLPDKLFDPFTSSKEGGSGVGLWQVKRLVNSLQGAISVRNNTNGEACFTIRLPLSDVSKSIELSDDMLRNYNENS